jgi:hypothetical protein
MSGRCPVARCCPERRVKVAIRSVSHWLEVTGIGVDGKNMRSASVVPPGAMGPGRRVRGASWGAPRMGKRQTTEFSAGSIVFPDFRLRAIWQKTSTGSELHPASRGIEISAKESRRASSSPDGSLCLATVKPQP